MNEDILSRVPPKADQRKSYGVGPENFVDIRYPKGPGPFPVLVVIHGGFWRKAYDLTHMGHLCATLAGAGIITCNIEYRRVGMKGGGWPGTFNDVSAAADYVFQEALLDRRFDSARVFATGFSAGGHLALWLSGRHKVPSGSSIASKGKGRLSGVVSIAGVSDLRSAWEQRVGGEAVILLMGGPPEEYPQRYDAGSPIELLPTGINQVLIHGTADDVVPFWQSKSFSERGEIAGERPKLVGLQGVGHFDTIDPKSSSWDAVESELLLTIGER